ncbi:hypothetical protein B7W89_05410 [Agrobacterium tumefaciens]|nr:hypothetical protein B7W89_05410 [Agrobacterium tumefaciens]
MVEVTQNRKRIVVTVGPPLCPAGHLPHRWGDQLGANPRSLLRVRDGRATTAIDLPLVGEMPGRAEGVRPLAATLNYRFNSHVVVRSPVSLSLPSFS